MLGSGPAATTHAQLLEGSWYLLTNENCTSNPHSPHIRAPKGLISG